MYPLFRKARSATRLAADWFAHRYCADHFRPSLFILGAQKSGTTALAQYLAMHPRIVLARGKEAHFFYRDVIYQVGQRWYARQFPGLSLFRPGVRFLDATPEYLYFPGVAERIRQYAPDARLMVMLREPVSRAWSAYTMLRTMRETIREHLVRELFLDANPECRDPLIRFFYAERLPTFAEVVEWEIELHRNHDVSQLDPSFVRRGLYADQLERYFKVFPREQLLILEDRELRKQREATMDRVCDFLSIEPLAWCEEEMQDIHVGTYRDRPDPAVVERLKEFYRPHNERLYALLGRQFDWDAAARTSPDVVSPRSSVMA